MNKIDGLNHISDGELTEILNAYANSVSQSVKALTEDQIRKLANQIKNKHGIGLMDDYENTLQQNQRMKEWFKRRTGLDGAMLCDHMKEIDHLLSQSEPEEKKLDYGIVNSQLFKNIVNEACVKFGTWYSGMGGTKVRTAYKRYIKETGLESENEFSVESSPEKVPEVTDEEIEDYFDHGQTPSHEVMDFILGQIDGAKWFRDNFLPGKIAREELLLSALQKIANPMEYLTNEAVKSGGKLDGRMAMQLCYDVSWVRQIARDTLKKHDEYLSLPKKEGVKE